MLMIECDNSALPRARVWVIVYEVHSKIENRISRELSSPLGRTLSEDERTHTTFPLPNGKRPNGLCQWSFAVPLDPPCGRMENDRKSNFLSISFPRDLPADYSNYTSVSASGKVESGKNKERERERGRRDEDSESSPRRKSPLYADNDEDDDDDDVWRRLAILRAISTRGSRVSLAYCDFRLLIRK